MLLTLDEVYGLSADFDAEVGTLTTRDQRSVWAMRVPVVQASRMLSWKLKQKDQNNIFVLRLQILI